MGYQTAPQFLMGNNILWDTPGHMMLSWTDNRNRRNMAYIQTGLFGHCKFQLHSPVDKMFPSDSNGQ